MSEANRTFEVLLPLLPLYRNRLFPDRSLTFQWDPQGLEISFHKPKKPSLQVILPSETLEPFAYYLIHGTLKDDSKN